MRTPVPPMDASHHIAAASSLCAASGVEPGKPALRDAAKSQHRKRAPNRGEIVDIAELRPQAVPLRAGYALTAAALRKPTDVECLFTEVATQPRFTRPGIAFRAPWRETLSQSSRGHETRQ